MSTEYVFIPKEEYQRLINNPKPEKTMSSCKKTEKEKRRFGVIGLSKKTPPGDIKKRTDWLSY